MLKEKNHRKFRNFATSTNSATIRKEIIPADSSEAFHFARRNKDELNDWKKRTSNSATLNRPDPFGIQDCFLDYSMNKKYRWNIPEEMEEGIEEIQDPFRNLRVSSSLHTVDHSQNLFLDLHLGNPIVDQPCKVLYDVGRDGSSLTKHSKTGKTAMRNLASSSDEHPAAKSASYQPLHIHYFAWEIADSASLYNKRANAQRKSRGWNGVSTKRPKFFNARYVAEDCFDE